MFPRSPSAVIQGLVRKAILLILFIDNFMDYILPMVAVPLVDTRVL